MTDEEYWENLARAQIEQTEDPAVLAAVCYAGAPLWLNQFFAHFQREAVTGALKRVAPSGETGDMLEIGCGTGRWLHYLSASGQVVGVDQSPSMLKRAWELGWGPKCCVGAAQRLPFTDNTFDLTLSVTCLLHVPDQLKPACVQELARVLRPGGAAILYETVAPGSDPHSYPIAVDGWVRLFRDHGMRMIHCQSYDYAPVLRLLHRASAMLPGQARSSPLPANRVKRLASRRALMPVASLNRIPSPLQFAARLAVALSYPVEYLSRWTLGPRLADKALMIFEKS